MLVSNYLYTYFQDPNYLFGMRQLFSVKFNSTLPFFVRNSRLLCNRVSTYTRMRYGINIHSANFVDRRDSPIKSPLFNKIYSRFH